MRKLRVPWIIACSLHAYRWLLTLTPDDFANVYSEPALHVFRQCCQDAYDKQGTLGVLNLWLPTFSDALYGIIAEQGSSLKKIFSPNLLWPAVLALGVVLFPFSWLSNTWQPFGSFFQLFFATPQDYFVGHVLLFFTASLLVLLSMPVLRQHTLAYIFCLMSGAFAEEIIQALVHAHPGLPRNARDLFLDLAGILLAILVCRLWQRWFALARA